MATFLTINCTKTTASVAASGPNDYTRLQEVNAALAGKANASHTHTLSQLTDLQPNLALTLNNVLLDTETLGWALYEDGSDNYFISGVVRVNPGGYLKITSGGLDLDDTKVLLPGATFDAADITDLQATIALKILGTLKNSPWLGWLSDGTYISGVPILAANSGLVLAANGLALNWGGSVADNNTQYQVPPGNHTHLQLHDPLTLGAFTGPAAGASRTLNLSLNGQVFGAEVNLAGSGGLTVYPSGTGYGVGVDFTAVASAASVASAIALAHDPVTAVNTPSLALSIDGNQFISGVVRCWQNPTAGYAPVLTGVNGLYLQLGTGASQPAAGNHGHAAATEVADGFLSAVDKTHLDRLWAQGQSGTGVLSVNGVGGQNIEIDTDNVEEGSTNLYFTDARAKASAIAAPLAGFSATGGGAILATDTVLQALQKTEYRLTLASGTAAQCVRIDGTTPMTGDLSFSGTGHAGLRLNNLTSAQRQAVPAPTGGSVVWDSNQNVPYCYNPSGTGQWVPMINGGDRVKLDGTLPMTGDLSFAGTGHAGLRLNNLTGAQVAALGSPLPGDLVYNSDTFSLEYYSASGTGYWISIGAALTTTAGSGLFLRLDGTNQMTGPVRLAPMTALQIAGLTPLPGMLVYNTDIGFAQIYDGSGGWDNIPASAGSGGGSGGGTTWYYGSGAPVSDLAPSGSLYLDTASGNIWAFYASGWTQIYSGTIAGAVLLRGGSYAKMYGDLLFDDAITNFVGLKLHKLTTAQRTALTAYTVPGAAGWMCYDTDLDAVMVINDAGSWVQIGGTGSALPLAGGTMTGNIGFSASSKGIVGDTTTGSAAAGNVGEFVQASSSPSSGQVTMVGSTSATILSISLTAGDWDVEGVFHCATPSVYSLGDTIYAEISTTATSTGTNATASACSTNSVWASAVVPRLRISINTTTTVYLNGTTSVVGSPSLKGYGKINARRVR